MPELPEVETVRRLLAPLVTGRTVQRVLPDPAFPAVLGSSSGLDPLAMLPGTRIIEIDRRGKYLLLRLTDGLTLVAHLRMTGRLLVVPREAPPVRFEHCVIGLSGGVDLRFGDQRKFGRLMLEDAEGVARLDGRLGMEPLSAKFSAAWLQAELAKRSGQIKSVLLDQRLIAGLGNIYADEALFAGRIHPGRRADDLAPQEVRRLARAIRSVLRTAITNGGTTFSAFENPYGEAGRNLSALRVYGMGGKGIACPCCGTRLQRMIIGGRGTSWCPACQSAESSTSPPSGTASAGPLGSSVGN